jgi:hypothetical protein
MSAAHLEKLNNRQRAAVEHGVGLAEENVGGPLLIIAGAGSGKTNTLAHRVAHLIVNNADPVRHIPARPNRPLKNEPFWAAQFLLHHWPSPRTGVRVGMRWRRSAARPAPKNAGTGRRAAPPGR